MELGTPTTQGCDGGLITWISAKPTDWTPEVNYHISWIMAEKSTLCGELRAPRCFIDSFFMLYFTYVSDIVIAGLWKFYCPATIRSEHMSEQAQGDLLQIQSQDDEQARRDPLPLEWPRGKVKQEKNSHTLPERPKLRNTGGPELLGLHVRDAQVKPYLEQQNLGKLKTAEHAVFKWDLWIGKPSPIRCRGPKIWQLKDPWWNRTSQDRHGITPGYCEVDHGIIEKSKSTLHCSIFWDCWIKVCWIEVKSFALLLKSTNQRSKLIETTKTYLSK